MDDWLSSNATGGDSDSNRYVSPSPGSSRETTHVFEFEINESAEAIDEVVIRWEGYSDWCNQCELYVWDVAQQQWGDGTSFLPAQNRFMDSWAGNRDGELVGILRENIGNYLDAENRVRFLIYGERSGNETFHDYASLTVKQATTPDFTLGDANFDGVLSNFDISWFVVALTNRVTYQAMFPDVDPDVSLDMNGDGIFDNLDISGFVAALAGI